MTPALAAGIIGVSGYAVAAMYALYRWVGQ